MITINHFDALLRSIDDRLAPMKIPGATVLHHSRKPSPWLHFISFG
jgi:hypothetical protein